MNTKTIIAEKPSVAAAIAKIVGANTPHRKGPTGYLEGGGYVVTWAFGHLVGLKSPEQMGFTSGELPMFPKEWDTRVLGKRDGGKEVQDPIVDAQMSILTELMNKSGTIIVATDAGREGELIFRYIYEHIGCRTYFERLWISSLTEDAIRKGMQELRPGSEFDALSDAAHARSQADWLVGFNGSRALRLATGFRGMLSLGRVQTPTLCMICRRYDQFQNFVPTPYWQIEIQTEKDSTPFAVSGEEHYDSEEGAARALATTKAARQLRVDNVEKKHTSTRPPLLFDLTELQRTANGRYGMTADQTLKLTQSLYEKKIVTYPRTGSRYIPEDVFATIPALLAKLASDAEYGRHAAALKGKRLCRRSVDDTKVTDHHALLPTGVPPTDITSQERKIYDLIATRTIEAFGENEEADVTNVTLTAGGIVYKAHGRVQTYAGWKAVCGAQAKDEDGEDAAPLPEMKTGDLVPINKAEAVKKTDKPLPIYTEKTLLGDMQTCGKFVEDEEAREAMKEVGLGTPATRAATIEALLTRNYIARDGKKLVPTELGTQIWKMVDGRKIADVQTTGEWERDLALVEQGRMPYQKFMRDIETFTQALVDDLLKNCKPIEGLSATGEAIRTCPVCGHPMKNMKFSISCLPDAGGCGFRISREICGKRLSEAAIAALTSGKKTPMIKGFTNKAGKRFDARLKTEIVMKTVTDDEGNEKKVREGRLAFDFDEVQYEQVSTPRCPCCGQDMKDDGPKLSCGCGFTLWKKQFGAMLTQQQLESLLAGKKTLVKGMTSKAGKHFDANLTVNATEKKIDMEFINNKKK